MQLKLLNVMRKMGPFKMKTGIINEKINLPKSSSGYGKRCLWIMDVPLWIIRLVRFPQQGHESNKLIGILSKGNLWPYGNRRRMDCSGDLNLGMDTKGQF